MIETITIEDVMPQVFAGAPPEGNPSEVWNCRVEFCRGESVLIEANSGRGKTSLCSFLSGLRTDYRGKITYKDAAGKAVAASEMPDLRSHHLGILFQDHRLFPELTVMENIQIKNQLTHYLTESEIRQMLVRLGLKERIDTRCSRLSLGQQQRAAFVRALCQPIDFLLLDEPISHLDDTNAAVMSQLVEERQQATGIGVLVTSIGRRLPYPYDRIIHL